MASQIISLTIVYSTVYSGADQRKYQSSVSLAFVWGIHWWPVNSPHKGPVTRKTFPVDDVIMNDLNECTKNCYNEQNQTKHNKIVWLLYTKIQYIPEIIHTDPCVLCFVVTFANFTHISKLLRTDHREIIWIYYFPWDNDIYGHIQQVNPLFIWPHHHKHNRTLCLLYGTYCIRRNRKGPRHNWPCVKGTHSSPFY